MTSALEGGEWSAARRGRTLPPGKNLYPFYRRLGGPQDRPGRAENRVPTGIRSRTVQPVVSSFIYINRLKPTGHVMHQQFNIQQLYALHTLYYVFCVYLRTNSDLCHLQHKLSGFYNRDEKCLQRGMDWVFK